MKCLIVKELLEIIFIEEFSFNRNDLDYLEEIILLKRTGGGNDELKSLWRNIQ